MDFSQRMKKEIPFFCVSLYFFSPLSRAVRALPIKPYIPQKKKKKKRKENLASYDIE
jgi:hypothetical protein